MGEKGNNAAEDGGDMWVYGGGEGEWVCYTRKKKKRGETGWG